MTEQIRQPSEQFKGVASKIHRFLFDDSIYCGIHRVQKVEFVHIKQLGIKEEHKIHLVKKDKCNRKES